MKKLSSISLFLFFGIQSFSQTQIVMDAASDNTTVNSCFGGLYDSGGTGPVTPYSNGESYVITICPDVPGDYITLLWTTFALDPTDLIPGPGSNADNITVYDGPNTASPTLGTYTAGQLTVGDIFGASTFNPSGCLTIEFNSNAAGTGNFTAQVTCETPCDPGTAVGMILNADNVQGDSIAVCVGETVTFQDNGSTPGTSGLFTIQKWVWKWFDGSPDDTLLTPGPVSHAFNQPGQYVVQLVVVDDNGCVNNNATDIQVFVTTYPTFDPFPGDTSICLGEFVDLQAFPNSYEVEWSGFPLGVWVDDNCMNDWTGILQTTPLVITGYDSNISLSNANPDVFSICVDIEHSFMGDFVLQIQCPTGQIMTLHQQGGGGCYLGEPEDYVIDCNDPATFGIPYHYCFTSTAAETWVDYVNGGGACPLPAGDYLPVDPLSFGALDGCPINGTWTMLFTDLWGADDGSMPGWSINFDPALNPPVTVYTPQIGLGPDSSYWDLSDPFIIASTPDADFITVQPTAAGSYVYDYTVINNFGCAYDSTITVTVTDNPPANAGPDVAFCNIGGSPVELGAPAAMCTQDAGNYTLCYGNNVNQTFTYCPDTPGDGLTFMSISFNAGTTETWFDYVTIYDGPTTGSPVIAGPMDGNLAGLSWQATNPSGCITMLLTSDGSVSCVSGSTIAWDYDVSCGGGGPQLVYSWTPNDGTLSDVTISNPVLINPALTGTYVLSQHTVGHPLCIETDTVTVCVVQNIDAGLDGTAQFCSSDAPTDLYNFLTGTPQPGGSWFSPAFAPVASPFDPSTNPSGLYAYIKDSLCCADTAYVDVLITTLQGAAATVNSDCQACLGEVTVNALNGVAPFQYSNDNGVTFQASNLFTGLCGSVAPGTTYIYIFEDALGCQATVDTVILDINFPTLNPPTLVNASCYTVCDGQITVTGTNISTYQITSSGGIVTNNATGIFGALCDDTYDILVDNGYGCTVTGTATITEPTPLQITSLTSDFVICDGGTTTLDVTGTGGNGVYTYTWTSGATNLGTGTSLNLTVPATMTVCVTMSENCPSPTVQQCMTITVPPKAFPLMTSNIVSGCAPIVVDFTNLTNYPTASNTLWTFSDGTSALVAGTGNISHSFGEPGLYDVMMTVTSIEGCVYDTTFVDYIEVFDYPNALFTYNPNPADIYNTEIQFNDYSSPDVTSWNWIFYSGSPSNSSLQNPVSVYPEFTPGDFPVILEVWNAAGCKDSVNGIVTIINDVVLFAPNIFTPDGDEFNEYWRVYINGIDIYDFHLTMFNRWGEIVWESYNAEGAWNGRYGNQAIVQDGTYIWVIEAKDTYNDKKYEFRGHVTVLK